MRTCFHIVAILVLAGAPFAHAGDGVWTGNGPDGGTIGELLIDPSAPATLYAGTPGGLFKSTDSGAHWTRAQNGLGGFVDRGDTHVLTLDASAPANLYAVGAGGGLFVSHDGAASWLPTGYAPASGNSITSIAKAPGGGALYIGTWTSGVLASSDGGASFAPASTGLPAATPVYAIAASANHPGVLLAHLADNTIYRSATGGASWTLAQTTGYSQIATFAFGAGDSVYLVAETLYRSSDGGTTWSATASQGLGPVVAHPNVANRVWFVDFDGHARESIDGGATSADISAGAVMANGADDAAIATLALAPTTTGVNYLFAGTYQAGVHRRDGAGTWGEVDEGLRATNIRALAPHPNASGRVLAGVADATYAAQGVYVSPDSAATWALANVGLRARDIRSMTYDPTSTATTASTIVYATGRGTFDNAAGYAVNSGLYKSTDGGASWSNLGNGLPNLPGDPASTPYVGLVRSLVLDPRSCASPPAGTDPCTSGPLRTIYASASGNYSLAPPNQFRLIKSIDGGANWTSIDGLPGNINASTSSAETLLPIPLVIDPQHPQRLYVGTSDSFDSTFVTAPTLASGVYRSDDGGATWSLRSTGLPFYPGSATTHLDTFSLAINPSNPDVLWASSYNLARAPAGYSHIYKTTDGGTNWSDSSSGITAGDIRQLIVDPVDTNVLYAAAAGYSANPAGVYKSTDGGATWHSISAGLENAGPSSVAIDPLDRSQLYVGTPSGVSSLRQLPDSDDDGVPDAVEQAGPNGGDSNGDGTPDYLQSNVAAIDVGAGTAGRWQPATHTPAAADGSGQYFSISVSPVVAGTCAQAVDAQSIDPASRPADTAGGVPVPHALALVRFELLDCPEAYVTVQFFGESFGPGWAFRYFGPSSPGDAATIGWYDLGSLATNAAADTWKLHLTAGTFGSYRPASANSILFEGGPARVDSIFRNGFDR